MSESEVLRNPSAAVIKAAIEANFREYVKNYWSQIEVFEESDIFMFYTGVPVAVKNGVMWARFTTQSAEQRAAKVVSYFRKRKVPFFWWISPSSSPENLGDILLGQGLTQEEWSFPAMAFDLRGLGSSLLPRELRQSGTRIAQVKTVKDLDRWFKYLTNRGYPEPVVQSMYDMIGPALTEGRNEIGVYLAMLAGVVVGVSKVTYLAGVAGIYWVDTQPEHRGKGVGTATTLAALHDARERGYEISTLQSSNLGYKMYSRIGFKQYFKYDVYRYTPE